ncbi:MAG TPA: ABC transporter permease [Terracidiphilus sp.]|nr:ABC transporter permease [Terracidiphilus sp.]
MRSAVHQFMLRVTALWTKRRLDRELAEELEFHQAMLREKLAREGMGAEEAESGARRRFGDAARWQERLRELWQLAALENLLRDVSFSIRLLRRSPGFTAVALLTLMLAVGATTSVFSLIDGLLLRPLPVPHADQLVVLSSFRSDDSVTSYGFSAPIFRGIERRHDIFPDVAAYSDSALQVRGVSGNVEVRGAMVSGEFFRTLEVAPLRGRYLTPLDDRQGGGPQGFAAVISESFWRSWFNSAPDVVGSKLTVGNVPFTVVGVMPRQFIGADPTDRPQIYVPLWSEPVIDAPYNNIAAGIHARWMQIIARRAPGVSLDHINAALAASSNVILRDSVADASWVKDAMANHFHLSAEPGSNGFAWLRSLFRKPLTAVFCLCAAMLLLACLNLASLLLARASARERELATRLAIGASRRRLVQQLMVESLLIAAIGTASGIAISPLSSHALTALLVGDSSHVTLNTGVDYRMVLFAVVVAFTATLLIGLIPAIRATSGSLNEQIKEGSHTSRARGRLLPAMLLGVEVALALMLVIGAGLLAKSLIGLYRTGLGFEPKGLVNISLTMDKQPQDGDALVHWYQDFGDALRRLPYVQNVSFEEITPLATGSITWTLHTAARTRDQIMYMNMVAPEYFRTMEIPLYAGRDFRWSDTNNSTLRIILNQTAAKLLFPGQDPLGQQVIGWNKRDYEVIAVVGDVHYMSVQAPPPPGAYISITQDNVPKPSYTAVVRTDGPVAPLGAAVRALAERMAPEIPAPVMTTMSEELNESISSERMMAILSVFFAISALLVTAIGLYGTLAFATARRTTEIGIRMALGAQRKQVVGLIVRENVLAAAGGSLAGLVAALLASHALARFLYGTSVYDPWVLSGSVLALTVVAIVASLIPAVRAAWIDPMMAIRCE